MISTLTIDRSKLELVPVEYKYKLTGRLLSEYVGKPINHEATLLGDRYLCRGGGMFVVAPSGVGKSVFSIQCSVNWSVGRRAFGIKPARPLRILIIQAEDDEGDVIEMSNLANSLNLSDQESALFATNVWMEPLNHLTGDSFTAELAANKLWQGSPTIKNFKLWTMVTNFAIKLEKQLAK